MRWRSLLAVAIVATPVLVFGATRLVWNGGAKKRQPVTLVATRDVAVSRLPGPQSESAIAVDPRDGRILLAGSNDIRTVRMAVYGSTDGGRHWTHGHLPAPAGKGLCGMSDPAVAIDGRGRQYYVFLGLTCVHHRLRSSSVYLASRPVPGAAWRTLPLAVARLGRLTLADDHPMLLVDDNASSPHRGRLYVGWTRFSFDPGAYLNSEGEDVELVDAAALVSYSDDGGKHWSRPTVLSKGGGPLEVRLAAGPSGELYATWRDSKTDAIYTARSEDGASFRPRTFVAAAVVPEGRSCHRFRARIPAQPRRCVSPNPVVSVDTSSGPFRGRVYVTYGSTSLYRSQDAYVAAFDPELQPLFGVGTPKQVNPPAGFNGPDEFLPTSAIDPESGQLWVCYYESGRRRAGKIARYACTASDDGGETWSRPRLVARVASDETGKRANRANGYGDYEGVAVRGGVAHAIWTDGRDLHGWGEEIYSASVTGTVTAREAVK